MKSWTKIPPQISKINSSIFRGHGSPTTWFQINCTTKSTPPEKYPLNSMAYLIFMRKMSPSDPLCHPLATYHTMWQNTWNQSFHHSWERILTSYNKNSQDCIKKIRGLEMPPGRKIVLYDVMALFTNIPVDPALKIIRNKLENDPTFPQRCMLSINQIMTLYIYTRILL